MMPFTPDNGPRVEVIPSTERRYWMWDGSEQWEDFAGFTAVCSCDWEGTFYPADDEPIGPRDRAHADATTEADEHAIRHGR